MKVKLMITLFLASLFLIFVSMTSLQTGTAGNPQGTPTKTIDISSDNSAILLSDASQTDDGGYNLKAAYAELKDLGKKYRKARSRDAKQRIVTRAEEVMGQLFNAKVQHEQRRIRALEKRLNQEKERLREMQTHKIDLVHKGVQKALNKGEMPEWAPEK